MMERTLAKIIKEKLGAGKVIVLIGAQNHLVNSIFKDLWIRFFEWR